MIEFAPWPLEDWIEASQRFAGPHGEIAYWDEGEGPPLLMIHGFPTASWDWSPIWTPLVKTGRRVIALDFLGFGLSDKPKDHVYDLMAQTDLQYQLLAMLGVEACDIVAHDYGVSVAQEMLARQAEGRSAVRIDSVSFLNGGLIPGEHRPRPIQKLMEGPIGPLISRLLNRKRFEKAFGAVFGPDTQPSAAEMSVFWTLMEHKDGHRIGHKLIRYMGDRRRHKPRWVGVLTETEARLRLINGALDPVSGAHLADAYERLIPDGDIVRFGDVGHYPQTEAPERVFQAIVEHLNGG